jgi:hypothetical protein
MENQAAKSEIVTTRHTCVKADGHALLCVNAGVPVELALEHACNVIDCIQRIALGRETLGAQAQATALQYLTDMGGALLKASRDGLYAYEHKPL